MALNFPPIYDPKNAQVRKRSAVDAGWVQLTPYGKEARLDDPNYPLTSRLHDLIEHDNEIDTAAVNPIIRTILIHNNTPDKYQYVRGDVLWLVQSKGGCKMHNGYRGLVYWTPVEDTNAADAYPFVMAEPGSIAKNACATVAVCTADATVMYTTRALMVGKLEPHLPAAGAAQRWSRPTTKGLQGECVVVERKKGGYTLRPLVVTLLEAHAYDREISICIHPPYDRPILGLYKHTR